MKCSKLELSRPLQSKVTGNLLLISLLRCFKHRGTPGRIDEDVIDLKLDAIYIEKNSKFTYDEFSKNHPELVSMNKEKAIDWLKNEYQNAMHRIGEDTTTESSSLFGEFLFIFLDKDMSGVLDSYEENYLVFACVTRLLNYD